MRTLAVVVCLVVSISLALVAQTPVPQAPAQTPQFRATVDLMRVDVTVLDRRTRRPVRGLTAEDFTIIVGGQEQPIRSHAEVTAEAPLIGAGAWRQDAARDVIVNQAPPPHARLVAIVMNDARGDAWHRRKGREIAHAVIDGLGPDDLAAVVFTNLVDNSQDFTRDKALLRAAVESFNPLANPRFAVPNFPRTIKNVREYLATVGSYRRAIVVIASRGFNLEGGTGAAHRDWFWLRDAGLKDVDESTVGEASGLRPASRLSHVPIHFFTTQGLQVESNPAYRQASEDTTTLARVAGGRAIVQNNAPELEVPAVLEEMSTYYALAYQPTFPLDGRLRFVDVKVNRPDVLVLPSSGAVRTAREADDPTLRRNVETAGRGSGLLSALAAPMMVGDLPLRASVISAPNPAGRRHPVVLTMGLPMAGSAGTSEPLAVSVHVYDGEGRRELSVHEQTVTVASSPTGSQEFAEIVLRLDLQPGRYNFRVAVEQASGPPNVPRPTGSAHLSVAVPDVTREPLSLSGLAVGRAEGRPIGGREALSDVLPFAPTTVRTFAATDRVGALLRVYQAGRSIADATVTTEIVNIADEVVANVTRTIPAVQFQSGVGVNHPYELPLAQLSAGDYLLRVTVAAGKHSAHRDVRFTVVSATPAAGD